MYIEQYHQRGYETEYQRLERQWHRRQHMLGLVASAVTLLALLTIIAVLIIKVKN